MDTHLFENNVAEAVLKLCRALAGEDLPFSVYVSMVATAPFEADGPFTASQVSLMTGLSPNAIRLQVSRNRWWVHWVHDRTTYVTLTEAGRLKLSEVHRRISTTTTSPRSP